MARVNYMHKSSTRGILLSITLLFSLALFITPSIAYAEEVNVKSFAFEETTIIELTNDSDKEVNTFRIWLGSDDSFTTYKTEKGWIGDKTPQGVIVFTSSESIKPGESVKFGVKTDKVKPGINWKALDNANEPIDTGKVLPEELPKVIQKTPPKEEQKIEDAGPSISTESTFRIVPDKPNVGSTIRVTGDKFAASQEFDFYINSKKLGSFETDENGHFITTMKIPENQKADRVDLKIKDKEGEEKKISLRIGDIENKILITNDIKLTIKGIPDIINRGDFLEIFGTGKPNSAIIASVAGPDGGTINSRTVKTDFKGNWKLDEPIIIGSDTPFGKYSATITDGREEIVKYWTLESDKVIIITSNSLKFEPGETMKFSGTALPNKSIEVVLEDPLGKEIFADIIQIDDSGYLEFEFPTTHNMRDGTYTLIATQGKEKEFIFAGLGQLPSIPINLEFDKLNYKASETATITLIGKGSEVVSLLIIDPSDKPKGKAITITLQPDGRGEYSLDLKGYGSGIYSAVISKGSSQSIEVFAIGLQTGSGNIEIKTTKINYLPSDSILILGDTDANSLLTFTLIDPDGNEVKVKKSYSDKSGKIAESSFRIPSAGKAGMWELKVTSGSNFDVIEIEVLATLVEGMQVTVGEQTDTPGFGKLIQLKIVGAEQTVEIKIIANDGEIIDILNIQASSDGIINSPWLIPRDTEPGILTINATSAFDTASTTFELK
jgi:hypothetical protein